MIISQFNIKIYNRSDKKYDITNGNKSSDRSYYIENNRESATFTFLFYRLVLLPVINDFCVIDIIT